MEYIADIGIGATVGQNDFDRLPIYKEMKEVTDDYGNKFIRIPKFYIKKTNATARLGTQISKEPMVGGYLPKVFWDFTNNRELPHVDVAKYLASLNGTRLESKSGKQPLASTNIVNFRNYAKNNGVGYQLLDIHAIDMLQALFYVEFGTLDSQSIHPGYTGGTEAKMTGGTDAVVASSGAMGASNLNQFKYRGIEDLWGNFWQWVDGVNIMDNQAWVCDDASKYASDVFSDPYQKLSYKNHNADGYATEMGFDPNRPYAQFPTAVGGSSVTYYGDYYYQNTGARTARFGGRWADGASAGVSCWYLSSASAYSASLVSGRLLKKALA